MIFLLCTILCRKSLRNCFENMSCFLMPKPGDAVASKNFQGAVKDISPDFIYQLKVIIYSQLSTKLPQRKFCLPGYTYMQP